MLADEHGQRIMGLAKDLAGTHGVLESRGRWAFATYQELTDRWLPVAVLSRAAS